MESFTDLDLLQRLALSLAIGLLVGLERGWKERAQPDGSRAAGFRTYGLIGLLGGIWGALSISMGGLMLGIAGLGFMAVFAFFEWNDNKASGSHSATGLVAAALVFVLGAYAVLGDKLVAGAVAVTATILLAEREIMHGFLKKLKWVELRAALLLLAMTVVLLPALPNRTLDPWDALNPFQLWLLMILIASVAYGGYIAVRVAGARNGLLFAGAAGGLVSSTTVTLTFARMARAEKSGHDELRAGIAIAWAVSLVRMGILGMLVAPMLIPHLAPPLGIAALIVSLIAVQTFLRGNKQTSDGQALTLRNPYELSTVFGVGAFLAVIMLAAKLFSDSVHSSALIALVAVSGLFDVDPITLSLAQMSSGPISLDYAAMLILLAGGTNLIAKSFLLVSLGGIRFSLPLLAAAAVSALCAGAWVYLV